MTRSQTKSSPALIHGVGERSYPESAEVSAPDLDIRKALACRAFWSDHPLNIAYRAVTGDRPFALKDFIAFVIGLPAADFARWA